MWAITQYSGIGTSDLSAAKPTGNSSNVPKFIVVVIHNPVNQLSAFDISLYGHIVIPIKNSDMIQWVKSSVARNITLVLMIP